MTDIDRLEAVLARLEEMAGPEIDAQVAVNPDGTPGAVASGELIESAWGNATATSIATLMHGPVAWYVTNPAGGVAPTSVSGPWGVGTVGIPAAITRILMVVTAEFSTVTAGNTSNLTLQGGIDGVAVGTMARGQAPANGYHTLTAAAVGNVTPGSRAIQVFVSGATPAYAGPVTALVVGVRTG